MNPEIKEKVQSLVQSRIDANHTTKARGYTSTTPNGTSVARVGMSVYLDSTPIVDANNEPTGEIKGDKQVEQISGILAKLSEEGKAGHPDPIIVKASGVDWVVVSSQLSGEENNFSGQPKIILADLLIGSNAEVTEDERDKSVRLAFEMRESNKNLRSQSSVQNPKVPVASSDEFDKLMQ